jgi:NodT family efflux transporter outer membrane factor (OMF) lipoprotein
MRPGVRLGAAPLAAALLAGCVVGPNYRGPEPPPAAALKLREAQVASVSPSSLPSRWWRLFDDDELDRLIEKALAHNTDLRQAAADLQRARAVLSEARAGREPSTQARVEYSRERASALGLGSSQTGGGLRPVNTDFYSVGFDASYEVDLFGGVTRSIEAARADYQAAQAQVDAARVSVAAETARAYVDACSFAAQAAVARRTAELQKATLDLTDRTFQHGRGTARDVDQARVLFEQANAQVPSFEAERRAALYALAVLTGDPPEAVDAAASRCTKAPSTREPIPVGDGQALLARRPDVRAAERTLAADVARIGVAVAQLYPSVTLAGTVTLGAPKVGDLGRSQSLTYSAGPLITWNFPLNGAARARVRESRASAQGSLAAFDGTVLHALQETEQALARLQGATEREAALARAADAAARAADLSGVRFRGGSDSFLQLLVAERDRATARAALAQAQADRADAQISLFKALGGGWEEAPKVASAPLPVN